MNKPGPGLGTAINLIPLAADMRRRPVFNGYVEYFL